MSGVAGGSRIGNSNVDRTFNDFYNRVLKNIDGFRKASLTGSVKAKSKQDYGDLDIVTQFQGTDKKEVKSRIIKYVQSLPDSLIIPFTSEKYQGKKYYNSGEIITVLFPINGQDDENIQIDMIIALEESEHKFKEGFLDLPAEKQGLLLGLAKVILIERNPRKVFQQLAISDLPPLGPDEEFEFNLSSSKLTLRKVKLQDFKEVGREEIWSTTSWPVIKILFEGFNIDGTFEDLLKDLKRKIKNPRSKRRIVGIFNSMVSVKSGEVGTPKGERKEYALQKVSQELSEASETGDTIGVIAGGFKPPHAGHFRIVSELAKSVSKIKVFVGHKIREGEVVTLEQSKLIWEIYSKYIKTAQLEIMPTTTSPIRELFEWVEQNSKNYSKVVIGTTQERQTVYFTELEKNKSKYPNTEVKVFGYLNGASIDKKLSGTDIRTNVNFLESLEWIPQEINQKDRNQILKILNKTISEEKLKAEMLSSIDNTITTFLPTPETNENNSGTPIAARSALPSKDRARLVNLYNQLRETIYLPAYDIEFQQDRIVITLKDKGRISYDYTPYMASLVEYMLDQKMKILPLPEVKLKTDLEEAVDLFGKTAYYDPYKQEIVLYIMGRHPKDVLRSFVHEMIHHKQNIEGKLYNIRTTNTNEDGSLARLEEEAYLEGNMTFRNWEDKVKNENK